MGDDWVGMMEFCKTADRAGFESLIPVGRWRGFGGDSNFNGVAFETYTWAAGLAAVTDQIAIVTTSHVPTVHPLFAAKQAATIDHISGGRFGLNIICGWFGPEMKMFGGTMMEHETRYNYADQWIEIVQRAWNDPGYFDYKTEYFNLTQAFSEPKPLNRPVLINAGGSPRGKRYCAEHCDVAFVILNQSDPDTTRKQIQSYRDIAAEYGKEIQIWCYSYCVQRDSLAESVRLATNRYREGYSPYLEQLDTQRQLLAAELNLAQVRADAFSARVALFLALGGGWSREDLVRQ